MAPSQEVPLEVEVGREIAIVGKSVGVEIPLSVGVRSDSVSVGIGVTVCSSVACALAS